jgi:transposase-like protein
MPEERIPGRPSTRRYTPAEREQAVRLVRQLRSELGTDQGTVARVAKQLGYGVEALLVATVPELLERFGVGPDTAAALVITAGDNPERLRSEAAWAHLCGVAPIPAGSGKTNGRVRHHQGGDRQANSAL